MFTMATCENDWWDRSASNGYWSLSCGFSQGNTNTLMLFRIIQCPIVSFWGIASSSKTFIKELTRNCKAHIIDSKLNWPFNEWSNSSQGRLTDVASVFSNETILINIKFFTCSYNRATPIKLNFNLLLFPFYYFMLASL